MLFKLLNENYLMKVLCVLCAAELIFPLSFMSENATRFVVYRESQWFYLTHGTATEDIDMGVDMEKNTEVYRDINMNPNTGTELKMFKSKCLWNKLREKESSSSSARVCRCHDKTSLFSPRPRLFKTLLDHYVPS